MRSRYQMARNVFGRRRTPSTVTPRRRPTPRPRNQTRQSVAKRRTAKRRDKYRIGRRAV